MSSSTPTATGVLASRPLPELLIFVLERHLTGTLVLEDPDGRKTALYMADGSVSKIKTGEAIGRLGELLVSMNTISESSLPRGLAAMADSDKRIGEALIGLDMLDEGTLDTCLGEQLGRKLAWCCRLHRQTAYGFYERSDLLEDWGGPVNLPDPLALIWRSIRDSEDSPRLSQVLQRLAGHPLRLHTQSRSARFGFEAKYKAVIDVLRAKPMNLGQLADTGLLDRAGIARLAYVLAITRHLDTGSSAGLPIGVAEGASSRGASRTGSKTRKSAVARSIAPRGPASVRALNKDADKSMPPSSGEASALRKQLLAFGEKLESMSYYDVLEVLPKADARSIKRAYFRLAKVWHPDRLPKSLADLSAIASKVFSRIGEANQVLSDNARRAEYDQLMEEGTATESDKAAVQQRVRATAAYRLAGAALKKNDLARALEQAKTAHEIDPKPEHTALFAYLACQDLLGRQELGVESLLAMLKAAAKELPADVDVHLYLARMHKQHGKGSDARRAFAAVAKIDPKNVEAAREKRLFKMREDSGSGASSPRPSFMTKLFKKK